MSEKWIDKDDCEIVRPSSPCGLAIKGCAVLIDAIEGIRFFVVPESFTDDQIWKCLDLANEAYRDGHRSGMVDKAIEIRKALGV